MFWFAGPLALFVGILVTLFIGEPAIVAGVVVQALSRVIVAVWTIARPGAQIMRSPIWWRIIAALLWAALAVALIWSQAE